MWRIPDVYPGSRILIFTHPGSRILDPKTVGEVKKICYHTFFVVTNFNKIEYYVIFEMVKKKIWANFQRIVEVFAQKIFNMLSNIWIWDPRSGIRKKPIPDPGSRGQKGTGSRIRIRNTAFWMMGGSGSGSDKNNYRSGSRRPQKNTDLDPEHCLNVILL